MYLPGRRSKTRTTRALRRALTCAGLTFGLSLSALTVPPQTAHAQEIAKDVPPGHWAYQAVQDLARKGLIQGYPPDKDFLGGRTLTRYEMATILQRVIARMDDLLAKEGSPQQDENNLNKLASSFTEIHALVDQFKVELTVIGAQMDKVAADLSTLKSRVDALGEKVGGLDKRIETLNKKVDASNAQTQQELNKKVDVGVGKLKIGGMLSVWFGTAFGASLGGNVPGTAVPPGRNFGGGVGDTFLLRYAQLDFDGRVTRPLDYHVMVDMAQTGTGSNAPLQDLVLGYQLARRWRLEVGQQFTGLSEEGTRKPGQLLTVEYSIMNQLPPDMGRVGNIRDAGVVLRYQSNLAHGLLGIWNGNGTSQNMVDIDRLKFLDAAAYVNLFRHMTLGLWGGTNVGNSRPAANNDRFGGTFLWQSGPHFFESEFAYARNYAAGAPGPGLTGTLARGIYFLYAHTLSRKWQLVIRYENWDPGHSSLFPEPAMLTTQNGISFLPYNHKLREYTIGFNYYLHDDTKIQLNYIREDPEDNGWPVFGYQRNILLTNFQVSF